MNTPLHLSKILGFKVSRKDPGYSYRSIGASGENKASVYYGVYTAGQKSLKYWLLSRGAHQPRERRRSQEIVERETRS